MDSTSFRSSVGGLQQADQNATIDSPKNSQGIRQEEGSSSRLSSRQDGIDKGGAPHGVKPLAYDADDVRTAIGNKSSTGRFKNWLADKLPFVGKTTYGKLMQKADAYSAQAGTLSTKERGADLKSLMTDITKWQNAHGATSAKGQAIEQLRQSVAAELGKPDMSRAMAMGLVKDEFAEVAVLNARNLFRGNSDAPKTLAAHMQAHVDPAYLQDIRDLLDDVIPDVDLGQNAIRDGEKATRFNELSTKGLTSLLDGTEVVLGALMGGTDDRGIQKAVDNLPDEVIRTLGDLDDEVVAKGGDATARKNAIIGTLFLRFATPEIINHAKSNAAGGDVPASAVLLSQVVQLVCNNPADDSAVTRRIRDNDSDQQMFLGFVRDYQEPMNNFVDAVLERAGKASL